MLQFSFPATEIKWFTNVCGNFAKFGFEQSLENVKKRSRDRKVGLNTPGKSQESSNRRHSLNVPPCVVPVKGTQTSGCHSSSARRGREKSEVYKALVGQKRGAGPVYDDNNGAKQSAINTLANYPGTM